MDESDYSVIANICLTRASGNMEMIQLCAGDVLRVGRVDSNDIILSESKVSRFHVVLNASKNGVVISDLNSLNGTLINGRRLKLPQTLLSGDVVEIGDSKLVVQLPHRHTSGEDGASATRTMAAQMQSIPLTVLLSDICNYTRLSESLPAVDVVTMLKSWCDMVSDIIVAHGGEVDKFIGDCVMAIWRATDREADWGPKCAIAAAFEIQKQTAELAQSDLWPHRDKFSWNCRHAVNTGEALFGSVAEKNSREVTVVGDTINVAFRLQDMGSKLNQWIILSEATINSIEGKFNIVPLGSVPVEGKIEEMKIFSLDLTDWNA